MMNNSVPEKTSENVRNQKNVKLVTYDKRSKLASKPNYHTTKHFSEKLLVIDMNKINVKINKP